MISPMKEIPKQLFAVRMTDKGDIIAVCNRRRDAARWNRAAPGTHIVEYRLRKERKKHARTDKR